MHGLLSDAHSQDSAGHLAAVREGTLSAKVGAQRDVSVAGQNVEVALLCLEHLAALCTSLVPGEMGEGAKGLATWGTMVLPVLNHPGEPWRCCTSVYLWALLAIFFTLLGPARACSEPRHHAGAPDDQ